MRVLPFVAAVLTACSVACAQGQDRRARPGPESQLSVLVGSPTDRSATLSVLSSSEADVYVEHGQAAGVYSSRTRTVHLKPGEPAELSVDGLRPNSACFYRLRVRPQGAAEFAPGKEHAFHTRRPAGTAFVFAIQGDSHPERLGKMFDPDLYIRTLRNVAQDTPDFHFMMGDDFSIERLFEQRSLSQAAVDAVYAHQRGYLGIVGASTPLMLVNGNHEQAAKYLLDGTATNGAVFAGRARTRFYPLPAPDPAGGMYSGNTEPVEHIGLLRDYYAWEWGDALFVVIDPYWHSSVVVDNEAGSKAPQRPGGAGRDGAGDGSPPGEGGRRRRPGAADSQTPPGDDAAVRKGKGNRDLWQVTLGDAQYRWLARTLGQSHARYKFVFCHHVLGTGRGGIEEATRYEWGGQEGGGRRDQPDQPARRGLERFFQNRPTWDKPIHALMRDTGVTIFFQGHDHLYAHQELDGVVYQTVPNPADPTFTAFNREAYRSGDILPNSGHLRVTVGAEMVKVEYVRSFRPADEAEGKTNGSIAHSYTITPRKPKEVPEAR